MQEYIFTTYLKLNENEKNIVSLFIGDWELFDFIENYLIENHDIKYDFLSEKNGTCTITFSDKFSFEKIKTVLMEIESSEIERIWKINNE